MTANEIEAGLTNQDWELRAKFARRADFTPTAAQVERGLTDMEEVARAFIARTDIKFEDWQIERGLTHENYSIRFEFARCTNFTPNKSQLERGLIDKTSFVRCEFVCREDIVLSESQIEACLTDAAVVNTFLDNTFNKADIKFTTNQIERGLTHSDPSVRRDFAKRNNILLSDTQILRGIKDEDDEVRSAFEPHYAKLLIKLEVENLKLEAGIITGEIDQNATKSKISGVIAL